MRCSAGHLKYSVVFCWGVLLGIALTSWSPTWLGHPAGCDDMRRTEKEEASDRAKGGCACGEDLERLVRLSRVALYVRQLATNTTTPAPQVEEDDEEHLKAFLYPPDDKPILTYRDAKRNKYRPGSRSEPKFLREEYDFKKSILVGVLTQQEYLPTRARSLYETWGKEMDKLIFFVGEDCNISADLSHLPIVKLQGIPDKVYPPLRKTFAVMKYMYQNHIEQFNWFIRADDDMYVRANKLKELLDQMHPYDKVYLGRAGTGRRDDLKRLRLLPHERYCMGGPGIILSMAALRGVGPHLNNCLNAVLKYSPTDYNDDDVEVGRCVSRKIDVQCSSSSESREYFIFDYYGDTLNPVTLWTTPILQKVITIHPVKNPNNMRSLHHFYKALEFQSQYEEVSHLAGDLNHLCTQLPDYASPPLSVSPGCDLKLHPHLAYFNASSKMNHRGLAPSTFLVQKASVPFYLKSVDKFDTHAWTRFNDSIVQEMNPMFPQHAPLGSLKAEVRHVLGMLRSHIQTTFKSNMIDIKHILDGYVRFNPHLGREYLLTLKLTTGFGNLGHLYKKYHVVREVGPLVTVVDSVLPSSSLTIHVILPLLRVEHGFYDFLKSYGKTGLRHADNSLHLVVVVFSQGNAQLVEDVLRDFTTNTYPASVSIVTGSGTPHFLKALDVGVASLEDPNDLVFLADVNTKFASGFFRRCRSNSQLGKQVYFPYPFTLYNSDFSAYSDGHTPNIAAWKGRWALPNVWMACIFKQDYDALGGYKDKKYSIDLYNTVLSSHLDLMQAPDPGLFRTWSRKDCRSLSSAKRRSICSEMRRSGGLQWTELANYLGEMETLEGNFLTSRSLL